MHGLFAEKNARASMRPFLAQARGGGKQFMEPMAVPLPPMELPTTLELPQVKATNLYPKKTSRRIKGFGGLAWVRIFISAPFFFSFGGGG